MDGRTESVAPVGAGRRPGVGVLGGALRESAGRSPTTNAITRGRRSTSCATASSPTPARRKRHADATRAGYALFVAGVWRLCGADAPATAALEEWSRPSGRPLPPESAAPALLIAAGRGAGGTTARGAGRDGGDRAARVREPGVRHLRASSPPRALATPLLTSPQWHCAARRTGASRARRRPRRAGVTGRVRLPPAVAPRAAAPPRPPQREPWRCRFLLAACLLAVSLLPPALWMARNVRQFDRWTLAESRVVPLARAELSLDLAREGRWGAALAWTPGGLARDLHRRWFPASRLDRWEWSGPPAQANYFVRAIHRRAALLASLGDRLAADAALRREAVEIVRKDPGPSLLSLPPRLWRGLFAERSPARRCVRSRAAARAAAIEVRDCARKGGRAAPARSSRCSSSRRSPFSSMRSSPSSFPASTSRPPARLGCRGGAALPRDAPPGT